MRLIGPVTASAVLFVLSFPNFSIWPLSFVCLVPFFIALDRSGSLRGQAALGAAWGSLISAGMGWWLVGTLMGHFEKGPVVSVLFVAAAMAVPVTALYALFAVIHHTLKKDTLLFSAVMVPSIWTAVEYLKEIVPFLLPWAGIGYAVTPFNLDGLRGESRSVTVTPRAYVLAPRPPAPEVSLMSLKPRLARVGWGRFQAGRSVAGLPLTLGKQVYEDGIGTHAPGEVVYDRKPEWKRFVAVLGLDEGQRWQNQSSLAGRIAAENAAGAQTPLGSSPVLRFGQREVWHFDVALPADCVRLRLTIDDGGDGDKSDHADWVNAGFRGE